MKKQALDISTTNVSLVEATLVASRPGLGWFVQVLSSHRIYGVLNLLPCK